MSEYLPPQEIHALTGYARPGAQAAWLAERGVPHRLEGRRLIISRVHVLQWLEGRTVVRSSGLKLSAIK
ncbi:MAG: hypothetical protein RL032_1114 [Pseudomonadota bacterium]|jgi:hypothetical protein